MKPLTFTFKCVHAKIITIHSPSNSYTTCIIRIKKSYHCKFNKVKLVLTTEIKNYLYLIDYYRYKI